MSAWVLGEVDTRLNVGKKIAQTDAQERKWWGVGKARRAIGPYVEEVRKVE